MKKPKYFLYEGKICESYLTVDGVGYGFVPGTKSIFRINPEKATYLIRYNPDVIAMAKKGIDPKKIAKKLKITLRAVQYALQYLEEK